VNRSSSNAIEKSHVDEETKKSRKMSRGSALTESSSKMEASLRRHSDLEEYSKKNMSELLAGKA
jgi:hypothetical protein